MGLEMATNFAPQKWEDSIWDREEEEEEEEEALSLCDLPLNFVKDKNADQPKKQPPPLEPQEDFDFGSFSRGCDAAESKMCPADDLFFGGQILPLRRLSSISSDGGGSVGFPTRIRSFSRSESLDHGSLSSSGFTSTTSSRSSSTRSHNSPGSPRPVPINRVRNPFHTYPSPKPQIRIPTGRPPNAGRSRKSTVWDIFRLGLVRTPEIELQDLKLRSNNSSRSSSNSNSNSTRNSNGNNNYSHSIKKVRSKSEDYYGRRKSFDYGFLSSCRCSINEVTTPSKVSDLSIKSGAKLLPTVSTTTKEEQQQQQKQKQRRHSMSRHRTFEWLKELSHAAGAPDDDPN